MVVTRKTGLEELLERFVTREQARFYLEHAGVPFEPYEHEQRAHDEALSRLKSAIPGGVRSQFVERSFLPAFAFGERDFIVTLGPDGMVVNVANTCAASSPSWPSTLTLRPSTVSSHHSRWGRPGWRFGASLAGLPGT